MRFPAFHLPAHLRQAMLQHARVESPKEAVGFLGGRLPHAAESVEPLVNLGGARSFLADPYSQYLAEKRLGKLGFMPIAIYHSHPGGSPLLSDADCRCLNPAYVQLVIAVKRPGSREDEIRAYILERTGRFHEIELI